MKLHRDSGDFLTSTAQPLDAAKAKITITEGSDSEGSVSTTFAIRVTGIDPTIDPTIVGKTLGTHLHIGPCVEGDAVRLCPADKPGHITTMTWLSVNSKTISRDTEVWFDLVPDEEGMAYDSTTVPFGPIDADPATFPA